MSNDHTIPGTVAYADAAACRAEARAQSWEEECDRLRARLAEVEASYWSDLVFLSDWIQGWVSQMHRDIPDEERGRIADDMCCNWVNSGIGASIRETRAALAQPKESSDVPAR